MSYIAEKSILLGYCLLCADSVMENVGDHHVPLKLLLKVHIHEIPLIYGMFVSLPEWPTDDIKELLKLLPDARKSSVASKRV